MADYTWDGGSSFSGKEWGPHLPTDAQIVMHCFCLFMETNLVGNFSRAHFRDLPVNPSTDKNGVSYCLCCLRRTVRTRTHTLHCCLIYTRARACTHTHT